MRGQPERRERSGESAMDQRMRRIPGDMNRHLSHESNSPSRHRYRYALSTLGVSESRVASTCNDDYGASRVTFATENDNAPLDEPSDASWLSQNNLPLHSACSVDRFSSNGENDLRSTCDCNTINHQKQDTSWKSTARRYLHRSRVSSLTEYFCDRVFQSPVAWRTNIVFLICVLCVPQCTGLICAPGLITPGWTWPQGDIYIEYGNPLEIFCLLNKTIMDTLYRGRNASNLRFYYGREKVLDEYITVINETAISMRIEEPPPLDFVYSCGLVLTDDDEGKRAPEAVCINKVMVGFPPQEPENFTCISQNWANLICSWRPRDNPIPTKYSLMFRLGTKPGTGLYPCPNNTQPPNTCKWDMYSDPIYRQPYTHYTLVLIVDNPLRRNVNFTYKISHYANVIPDKPTDLNVFNRTVNSVTLMWDYPFPLKIFPPGLHSKIMYQNQWDNKKSWKVIIITQKPKLEKNEKKLYTFTNLEYANTVYDVRISLKSALNNNNMWGEHSSVTFRTLPTVPSSAPKTDFGSFETSGTATGKRNVYLYWQTIPQQQENGDKFKYEITNILENGREKIINHTAYEMTRTYVQYKDLNTDSNYEFVIAAANEIGRSKNQSVIFVPRKPPPQPIAFTKIAFDGGLYELSWKKPANVEDLTNYTIFWCENERDRPYQCTGYLAWTHVSSTVTVYNITVPNPAKVYQFAISLNTKRGSSGMVWASCTVIHNQMVGKMKSLYINRVGSTFIEIGWKFECSDRIGMVIGYNIYYCPIASPYNFTCKYPELNNTIKGDPDTSRAVINDLKPYTTYRLSVAVLTKNGESELSDALYNTTLEAAPTVPRNVTVSVVTNTTMLVTWEPPEIENGMLKYYEVHYNSHLPVNSPPLRAEKFEHHAELKNLSAYTYYNISVVACTVLCSPKSPVIHQRTQIGTPSQISTLVVRFINASLVLVKWNVPQYPAGPLDASYYEVETNDGRIQNTTNLEMQLPIVGCTTDNQDKTYRFRVRAVNIDSNNQHLRGPWSSNEGNCYQSNATGMSVIARASFWVVGGILIIIVIIVVVWAGNWALRKCRDMQNVEVRLPPGLASDQKLLQNKTSEQHIRQPSADSSGCSSGQESVTSSLTAESQVSSDSGTEVDPTPVSPDKLLETHPTWDTTTGNLRLRNVMREQDLDRETAPNSWTSYITVTKSEQVLGETMSLTQSTPNLTNSAGYTSHTWSSAGYISMPSSEELSSNPSPVPRENIVATSIGYSVIGSIPMRAKSQEGDNVGVAPDDIDDTLIKPDVKHKNNSYVSLASLEQKQKLKPVGNTFRKFKLNTLALNAPDKTSKSYVQAGLIDMSLPKFDLRSIKPPASSNTTICNTFGSFTDSCSKPSFTAPFVIPTSLPFSSSSPSSSLTDTTWTSTKPHVAMVTIPEVTRSPACSVKESSPQKTFLDSHVPSSSDVSSKLDARFVQQMLQQKQQQEKAETSSSDTEIIDEDDAMYPAAAKCWQKTVTPGEKELNAKLTPNKTPIITKHKSGYVTIAENPNLIVPASQSDEQYSKVTVVPSTIQ